jgi:protein involved in polysaccharide export with SLBB domain
MMEYFRNSIARKLWVLMVIAFLACSFMGCEAPSDVYQMESEHERLTNVIQQQVRQSQFSSPRAVEEQDRSSTGVLLKAGDEIEIKFYYTPELDITQVVRPDGKISLQLIGEIEAQGKTPARLREELLKLYVPHLKQPEIAVIVRTLLNRRLYVGGEVITPGLIEMPGEIDVLEAIMQAGGFRLPEAEFKNVIVIRHREGQRYAYSINLERALKGDVSQPFYLQPQDIVYVPRTTITKVNQWVDQHINKLIPQTGLYITRTSGNTTIGYSSRY